MPLIALTLTALAGSGCLTDGTLPEPDLVTAPYAASLGVNIAASTRLGSGVYIRDLSVGAGAVVVAGQELSVWYAGYLVNGTKFDERAPGTTPLQFRFGVGQVIPGWDYGIQGMRVGGVRQLVIPPALAYGQFGSGPIPGQAILVFRVEVVAAQ